MLEVIKSRITFQENIHLQAQVKPREICGALSSVHLLLLGKHPLLLGKGPRIFSSNSMNIREAQRREHKNSLWPGTDATTTPCQLPQWLQPPPSPHVSPPCGTWAENCPCFVPAISPAAPSSFFPLLCPQEYHVLWNCSAKSSSQSTTLSMISTPAALPETSPCVHLVGRGFWEVFIGKKKWEAVQDRDQSLPAEGGQGKVEGWIQVGQSTPVLQPTDHN